MRINSWFGNYINKAINIFLTFLLDPVKILNILIYIIACSNECLKVAMNKRFIYMLSQRSL